MGRKVYDMIGMRFGRYTVIQRAENEKNGEARWLCRCDCGTVNVVRGSHLRNNEIISCGCYARDQASTHKMSKTRLYKIWVTMKQRCYNPQNKKYKNYGLRGIIICEEWLNNFEAFKDWSFNNGYTNNLTIDRVDVNGNYEPDNCRWADMRTQQNNRTNNRIIEYNEEKHTVSEWSDITGIPVKTLYDRLSYKKWTLDDVFTRPVPKQYKIGEFK